MSTRGDILRRAAQVEPDAVPEPWGPSDDEEALATVSDREHYRKNLLTLPDGAGEVPAYVWDFPRTPTIPDDVREGWTRGSAGRVLGPNGQYVSKASDVPRKSFDGEDPGLLVEAAGRRNYVQKSADATAWSTFELNTPLPTRTSILDGETAHLLDSSGVGEIKRFGGRAGTLSGNDETVSVILEESQQPVSRVSLSNQSSGTFLGFLDLDWSKKTSNMVIFSNFNDEKIREITANGPNGDRVIQIRAYVLSGNAENVEGENRTISLRSDKNGNAKNIIFHHAQIEEAPNASSPIVTQGSPVTRSGDDYAIFEGGQPSWWNPNEGTLILEWVNQTFLVEHSTRLLASGDGEIFFGKLGAADRLDTRDASSNVATVNDVDVTQSFVPLKAAISLTGSEQRLSLQGSSTTAPHDGSMLGATEVLFSDLNKWIAAVSKLRYIDRALSESTLNRITS